MKKKLLKVLRFTLLIILVILASFGIGLIGGVPIIQQNRKKEKTEQTSEEEIKKDVSEVFGKR